LGFRETIILQGFLARNHHDFHYIQISPSIIYLPCTVAPGCAAIQFFAPTPQPVVAEGAWKNGTISRMDASWP
jgi:hypothetical protein